jgi:hypothetical protein
VPDNITVMPIMHARSINFPITDRYFLSTIGRQIEAHNCHDRDEHGRCGSKTSCMIILIATHIGGLSNGLQLD